VRRALVARPTALRQAIAKAIVAYYQKFVDEQSKLEIKEILLTYDRTLLVADPRRCEPKKCVACAWGRRGRGGAGRGGARVCVCVCVCVCVGGGGGLWRQRGLLAFRVFVVLGCGVCSRCPGDTRTERLVVCCCSCAQVWWSRRARSLPEVVPLNSRRAGLVVRGQFGGGSGGAARARLAAGAAGAVGGGHAAVTVGVTRVTHSSSPLLPLCLCVYSDVSSTALEPVTHERTRARFSISTRAILIRARAAQI
jgi:hypothetical protein